jgi:small subunit ribosomal protein S9
MNIVQTVGRRKTAAAQIRMIPSSNGGAIRVNKMPIADFFRGNLRHAMIASQILTVIKNYGNYDFDVTVRGGGLTGQAESIRHGIARAVAKIDPKFRLQLRKEGYMTRDPRAVERKKSGQPKARKRFQYSKR